jgi:NAD/NADP transhydrogenase beta subunit
VIGSLRYRRARARRDPGATVGAFAFARAGSIIGLARVPLNAPTESGGDMFDSTMTVILLAIVVVIYMLPSLIAFGREHWRRGTILVLNLVFGWTLVGWILIFLWAGLGRSEAELYA